VVDLHFVALRSVVSVDAKSRRPPSATWLSAPKIVPKMAHATSG
jgi:hypothetical protein